jgi:hypothetical protein
MIIDYVGVKEINGSLIVMDGVKGVSNEEIVDIRLDNGTMRQGRVVQIEGERIVVQVFEGTRRISLKNTRTRLTGHPMEMPLSPEIIGRVLDGAGRLDRVKRSVWVTLAIGVIYTLCTGAALLAGQDAILHLFTADEAVVTYGKLAMRWFCPFYFLLSILHGLAGAVRGTGASIPPMVVLLVSLCLFRVVWIQFLLPFFSGIEGVFILYPVSWGLGALLMILYAWKGKWMEYHT